MIKKKKKMPYPHLCFIDPGHCSPFQNTVFKGTWYTWYIFHNFLQGRQLLWFSVCFPAQQDTSKKESTLIGKNLLPLGANSSLLEYTPFQKGAKPIVLSFRPWNCSHSPVEHFLLLYFSAISNSNMTSLRGSTTLLHLGLYVPNTEQDWYVC